MTKILLRSQILELISKLKTSKNFSDKNIESAIEELKKIGDGEFVIQTLLKEINCQDSTFDCVLALIAQEISAETCQKQIWELLNLKTVSDRKKIFLINLLRDMGAKVDYNHVQAFISNPDAAVDIETEAFLKVAKINPEAQIDFLDFFFTVSENDKNLLLNSIIEDFSGDELANVLAPIIYFDPFDPIIPDCIEALKKCKSYLAFEPLNWIIDEVGDRKLKQQAKRIINELRLLGLRKNYSKKELFKENLKTSAPLGFWVSPVDGANNFSLIFARQRNGQEISTFFTVINIENGASACFGFDSIDSSEFEKILRRFFADSYIIRLEIPIGQKLLEDAIKKTYERNHKLPYELLCWRSITYDIESANGEIKEIFAENLKKVELNELNFKKLLNENCIENWFFKFGENAEFDSLIGKITEKQLKDAGDIKEIENLIEKNLDSIFGKNQIFDDKLLYQSYFLSRLENNETANALFALTNPSEFRNKFLTHILKKSIYQYFLSKKDADKTADVSVFAKNKDKCETNIDADFYINLIENEWVDG